jgi:hypothetical protein
LGEIINVDKPGFNDILAGLRQGDLVPYLGPGAVADVVNPDTGETMPADNRSLILAMNNGKPMAPRLMYEFSRAAMNLELKRGRSFVNRFLVRTYLETSWTRATLHEELARSKPPYVIDVNRDNQLLDSYRDTPHTLIVGLARVGGMDYRFRIYAYDGVRYREIEETDVDEALPKLFKPLGVSRPKPSFIASDADFVDYITELMGGFAIPAFLKNYRRGKRYLLLGLRLTHDTERMILSNILHGAGSPAGWALIAEPTPKERRFCGKLGIEIIEADVADLLIQHKNTGPTQAGVSTSAVSPAGIETE